MRIIPFASRAESRALSRIRTVRSANMGYDEDAN